MTPRCSQCGWHKRDADEVHGTLECRVYMAARLAASEAIVDGHTHRGVDVGATRRALRDVVAMAQLYGDVVADERDAARAELAGVAAQRGAHLSRSVELAARVTELEARLAALTPTLVEVDGFRVGDLVRHRSSVLSWGVVDGVGQHVRVVYPGHDRGPDASSYRPDELTRKPVKVGDTVRTRHLNVVGVVERIDGAQCFVAPKDTSLWGALLADCIAVAP